MPAQTLLILPLWTCTVLYLIWSFDHIHFAKNKNKKQQKKQPNPNSPLWKKKNKKQENTIKSKQEKEKETWKPLLKPASFNSFPECLLIYQQDSIDNQHKYSHLCTTMWQTMFFLFHHALCHTLCVPE